MIDIDQFILGLRVSEDSTKSPIGSAQTMKNVMISDRGGISKRPGTLLLGTLSTASDGTKGFYTYTKSFGDVEIPMRAYSTTLEYYNGSAWATLEGSFTDGSEWGFAAHQKPTENEDYLYMCNRTEDYRRWNGAYTLLNGDLLAAATTVTVDSTLDDEVYYSGTADSLTTTTIDVTGTPWATDQWNGFYVKITSGTKDGYISPITDTDSNTITFTIIAGLAGTPTFEIRTNKFAATGTLVINGTEVAYTAMPTATTFTVGSAPASSDNDPVTVKPTAYPANPKGNVLANYLTRMIVGNVRSGLGSDGTNLQGSQSTGSYYASNKFDASDFTFTTTGRAATEGDVVSVARGNGIKDIVGFEQYFLVGTPNYMEGSTYTQDSDDQVDRTPFKSGVGLQGKFISGKDDTYFVTPKNEITTLRRAESKDLLPETENLGFVIKRLIDSYDFSSIRGHEFKDRIYFACKESSSSSANDRLLVWNKITRSFEGLWHLSAFGFSEYSDDLYYADSKTPNVFKMLVGTNDIQGTDEFGITFEWKSNWMNFTPKSHLDLQSINSYGVEGYISNGTSLTFELYKDFESDTIVSFTFTGSESDFIDSESFSDFLGADPLGISPEAVYGDPDDAGLRHFKFVVYFPDKYSNHFATAIKNSGKDQRFDITRLSLGVAVDSLKESTDVKTL